jgi:hypothetical protein
LSDNSGGTQFHQFVGSLVVIWLGCVLLIDHFFFQPSSANTTASADLAVEMSDKQTPEGSVSVNVESMIASEVRAAKSFVHMLEKEQGKAGRSKSRGEHSASFSGNSLGVELLDSEAPHSSQLSEHRAPSMDIDNEIDAMRNISVSIAALVPCKYGPDMTVRFCTLSLNFFISCSVCCMHRFMYL